MHLGRCPSATSSSASVKCWHWQTLCSWSFTLFLHQWGENCAKNRRFCETDRTELAFSFLSWGCLCHTHFPEPFHWSAYLVLYLSQSIIITYLVWSLSSSPHYNSMHNAAQRKHHINTTIISARINVTHFTVANGVVMFLKSNLKVRSPCYRETTGR